jgi:hypothetical protein
MIVRRIVFALVLFSCSTTAFSQATIGFTFSPLLSTNRVHYERDTQNRDFTSNDTGLRFSGGPILDIELTENYYASTGILFISKRAGITIQDDQTSLEEVYNLQYVALPATLKLFTNEVSLDTKVYFQFGGTLEFLVTDKKKEEDNIYITDFSIFDTSLLFGIGVEYKAGYNTSLFGGFSYSRGMINSVEETRPLENNLIIKNDLLSLNLGIKF